MINGENEAVLYRQWFAILRRPLRQGWLYFIVLVDAEYQTAGWCKIGLFDNDKKKILRFWWLKITITLSFLSTLVFWLFVTFFTSERNRKKRCTTCQHSDILFWRFSSQCLSPLMLWVRISIRARCTTLCGNVCKWLATCRWFSQVSSTNQTDRYDITEALLKVALNTIILTLYISIDIHICICVDIDIVLSVLFQCWSIILQ